MAVAREPNTYSASGLGRVVDERDRLVELLVRQHGQDRAEDLVLHHGGVGLDAREHRRRDVARIGVALARRRRPLS